MTFRFEYRVMEKAKGLGFWYEHGGTYVELERAFNRLENMRRAYEPLGREFRLERRKISEWEAVA